MTRNTKSGMTAATTASSGHGGRRLERSREVQPRRTDEHQGEQRVDAAARKRRPDGHRRCFPLETIPTRFAGPTGATDSLGADVQRVYCLESTDENCRWQQAGRRNLTEQKKTGSPRVAHTAQVTGMITILAVPRPATARRSAANSAVRSDRAVRKFQGWSTGILLDAFMRQPYWKIRASACRAYLQSPLVMSKPLAPRPILVKCRNIP